MKFTRPFPYQLTLFILFITFFFAACTKSLAFSFNNVADYAHKLAQKDFNPPKDLLSNNLKQLKFEEYQQIQSNRDEFLWHKEPLPFHIGFFHTGMQYTHAVKINIIENNSVKPIPFDSKYFSYGNLKNKDFSGKDFAGFRILSPLNSPTNKRFDEIVSFLGASYFRAIGQGQTFGLSARGLSIDTALNRGEEFPFFKEFWIVKPKHKAKTLRLYALLDSPSATGAYQFTISPNDNMVIDVKAQIYLRHSVGLLGIAPLTSMFLYDQRNQRHYPPSFRPELHDSNGLLMINGNQEQIWRPLNNPSRLAMSFWQLNDPIGFGLLQRNHDITSYQDLSDRYDLRPSAWIKPKGKWGEGQVELVELPTPNETNDNIVAFWIPKQQPDKKHPLKLDYQIIWTKNETPLYQPKLAYVIHTFKSKSENMQADLVRQINETPMLVIDFAAPKTLNLDNQSAIIPNIGTNGQVNIRHSQLKPNPEINGWRLSIQYDIPNPEKVAEIRANLMSDNKAISETWSYQIPAHEKNP